MIYRKANRPWYHLGGYVCVCGGVRSAPVPGVGATRLSPPSLMQRGRRGPASERDALALQGTVCPSRVVVFNYVAKRLQDTLHLSSVSHGSPVPREPKPVINAELLASAHPPSLQRLSRVRRSFYRFTFWEGCQRFIIKVPHIITA